MIEYQSKSQEDLPGTKPTIAVVGIGGAGANVLDRIALEGLTDAELISMNSDVRALANSVAPTKIQLGKMLTQGLGAGGDPDLGRDAALASIEEIRESMKGKDLVFLCSGQGGGIGSGAAPLIAQAAKEQGAFVVVFATMPFCFEGKRRLAQARQSLDQYRGVADALITFDNDRMGELILPKEGIQQAFAAADQIISQSIRAVTSLVTQPGLIHIGMDDLISALRNNDSRCLFGYGAAKGQNRAQEALKRALKSPLLDKGKLLEKSKNLLVHISGGETMTLYEVELLMNALEKHVPETTQILFGASSDKSLGDSLSVTLISSLAAVEMSGTGEEQGEAGAGQPQQQIEAQSQVPALPAAAAAASDAVVNVTSGESILHSSPMAQHPVAQQPVMAQQPVVQQVVAQQPVTQQPLPQRPLPQRPLAEVSAQVAQREPEIVEPPLTPYPPSTYQQPSQGQPAAYSQPSVQGQSSQASGLGKSSEPVQAATAAVESAQDTVAKTTSEDSAADKSAGTSPVSLAAAAAATAAGATTDLTSQAPAEVGGVDPASATGGTSVSIGAVPPPDSFSESDVAGDIEEVSGEAEASVGTPDATVVEVKIPAADEEESVSKVEEVIEAKAETEEEPEADVEEEEEVEAEAETEEEPEADVEEEEEVEAEAETEEEPEAEVEEEEEVEAEAETEEEPEAEVEEEEEVEAEAEIEEEPEAEVEEEEEVEAEAETEEEPEAEVEEEEEVEAEAEIEDEPEAEVEEEEEVEAEAEIEDEPEAEVEEEEEVEAEAEIEDEPEAEVEEEEEVEAEAEIEDEPEAEGKAVSELESKDDGGEDSPDSKPSPSQSDSLEPELAEAKGTPQTVILKPVVRRDLAPAAKSDVPERVPDEKPPHAVERPQPAVDMASALAEVEKSQKIGEIPEEAAAESESMGPMGTMGPAAALGLKTVREPAGPSSDSVGRPTVTAGDPRTGKQQMLELEPVAKGRFDKAEPTVVDGEDLDIPTFLRKKGNYN